MEPSASDTTTANPVSNFPVTAAPLTADSPEWLRHLHERGWAIIKGAVPPERAARYSEKAYEWLEGFKLGYKRDDPSTWRKQNLPKHNFGGLYSQYSFAHSQFVWDIKTEPGIQKVFEEIWGTPKLTVSFDGGNLSVPLPPEDVQEAKAPWPHADQSPLRPDLGAIQGLLNLLPNGPEDGGLVVMNNSANKFGQLWKAQEKEKPANGWTPHDHIRYTPDWVKWLQQQGCEIVKPNLDPGDFIVWDSRTAHYGQSPTSQNHRMAVYVCYKPDQWMTDEARALKKECFEKGWCTSHDPITFIPKPDQEASWNISFPYGKPQMSKRGLQAVGIVPYD